MSAIDHDCVQERRWSFRSELLQIPMEEKRCDCGYVIGNNLSGNCSVCTAYNVRKCQVEGSRKRNCSEAHVDNAAKATKATSYVDDNDDVFEEDRPAKAKNATSATKAKNAKGLPQSGLKMHNKAVATARSKAVATALKRQALQEHVRVAKQMRTTDKAIAFVNSIPFSAASCGLVA